MNHIVFFDLETSGLDPQVHEIIQIAAVACRLPDLDIVDEFEVKVRFDLEKASPDALNHNSYTPSKWRDAIHVNKAMNMFKKFMSEFKSKKMISKWGNPYYVTQLAGHNVAGCDMEFLKLWFFRREEFMPASFIPVDTMQQAGWLNAFKGANFPDLKLATLAQHFNLKAQTHDALDDVRLNVEVAKKLLEF